MSLWKLLLKFISASLIFYRYFQVNWSMIIFIKISYIKPKHIKHFESKFLLINGILYAGLLLQNNKNIRTFHSYEVFPCVPRMSSSSFDFHRHKSTFWFSLWNHTPINCLGKSFMVWFEMVTNMGNIGFHAKSYVNGNVIEKYASSQKLWQKQNWVWKCSHFLCILAPFEAEYGHSKGNGSRPVGIVQQISWFCRNIQVF